MSDESGIDRKPASDLSARSKGGNRRTPIKALSIGCMVGGLVMVGTNIRAEPPARLSQSLPNLFPLPNASGFVETYNINNAAIDLTGPFFQSLGTNGRSCSSCHRPAEAWSVSTAEVQLRFLLTQGLGPRKAGFGTIVPNPLLPCLQQKLQQCRHDRSGNVMDREPQFGLEPPALPESSQSAPPNAAASASP